MFERKRALKEEIELLKEDFSASLGEAKPEVIQEQADAPPVPPSSPTANTGTTGIDSEIAANVTSAGGDIGTEDVNGGDFGNADAGAGGFGNEVGNAGGEGSAEDIYDVDNVVLILLPKVYHRFVQLKTVIGVINDSRFEKLVFKFNSLYELFKFFIKHFDKYQKESERILRYFNLSIIEISKQLYTTHKSIIMQKNDFKRKKDYENAEAQKESKEDTSKSYKNKSKFNKVTGSR